MDKKEPMTLEESKELAKFYTNSIKMAVSTIDSIVCPNADSEIKIDIKTLHDEIHNQVYSGLSGGSNVHEIMLHAQAKTLDTLFNKMARRVIKAKTIETMKMYADVSLRVQNQCRKTILAINTLTNPPQQHTFVKQQNVAVNQQVNNVDCVGILEKKSQNELIRTEKK